ncbi:MAG TPA: DUF3307 domain-containing protein [Solirubrobacteraceae bacterium]|nr:DUF3307 domain-containing protein [Solirubrobacteraceae bacterium]
MTWVPVFAVFVVSHLTGDYLLQTEWQATHKRGGLTGGGVSRRALFWHVGTYLAAYIPAFIWLWGSLGAGVLLLAVLIGLPHLIQDDGRLLAAYARSVKHTDLAGRPPLGAAVDQSAHVLALFLTALVVGR